MSINKNYLLGRGELLTHNVTLLSVGGVKKPPYDFSTARARVATKVHVAASVIRSLPADACPDDEAVAVLTLHPRYISKSDFPDALLREVGLRPIGSRPREVKPDAWGTIDPPESAITAAVFVAGRRSAYEEWDRQAPSWDIGRVGGMQLTQVEDFNAYTASEKIRGLRVNSEIAELELVLHAGGKDGILDALVAYAIRCDARLGEQRIRRVDDLWFIPATCPIERVDKLAQFSFLRVVRGMPELRPLKPTILRSNHSVSTVQLPSDTEINHTIRIAIFDGGLPQNQRLDSWVRYIEPAGIGPAVPEFEVHGLQVTSAALFGSLTPGAVVDRPFSGVDHYRVLDQNSGPFELIDVLDRITNVLNDPSSSYHFVNLSLGPDMAVEDDEVTLWTATLDEIFASPFHLLTVAAGNSGSRDSAAGLNRIQPPGDAVNGLCVGAADSATPQWARASYSSVGPGRCPGVVKPDGLAFGGSASEPFYALDAQVPNGISEVRGTSFAAPSVIRASAGVGVILGGQLHPLAIRALLIHRAEQNGVECLRDAGWGRLITNINDLILCGDDEAHVIYQGDLPVGQHLRAQIPLPNVKLPPKLKVEIKATLCISPRVNAAHPSAYTRSGLEVYFRPHEGRYRRSKGGKRSTQPETKAFFSPSQMYRRSSEIARRADGKWEPVLSSQRSFKAEDLQQPCFDIYYHHRISGMEPQQQDELPYALVVTVSSKGETDFYNSIVRAYPQVLLPLQPVVQVPIRASKAPTW